MDKAPYEVTVKGGMVGLSLFGTQVYFEGAEVYTLIEQLEAAAGTAHENLREEKRPPVWDAAHAEMIKGQSNG